MSDIRIVWNPDELIGDWLLAGRALDTTREIMTAVAVSLFSHRTALADDALPSGTDRRGWWGDTEAREIHGGTPIGSRLWLLSREKQTEQTRVRAEDYCREALAWLVADRIATRVDVTCVWFAHQRLGAEIDIYRGPAKSIAVRFEKLWNEVM